MGLVPASFHYEKLLMKTVVFLQNKQKRCVNGWENHSRVFKNKKQANNCTPLLFVNRTRRFTFVTQKQHFSCESVELWTKCQDERHGELPGTNPPGSWFRWVMLSQGMQGFEIPHGITLTFISQIPTFCSYPNENTYVGSSVGQSLGGWVHFPFRVSFWSQRKV